MEQMAIDFVINTWGYKSASSEQPDYPASMLHFITPPGPHHFSTISTSLDASLHLLTALPRDSKALSV